MTPELWQRLKPLYEAALDVPGEQRAQFIAEVCKDDIYLKEELERLLESTTAHTLPLDSPLIRLGKLFKENQTTLSDGQVLLSRFRIVRHLGSGGMGDVYEAVDLHLQMGRVALKVIRPSIAQNPANLARFKEEVILARRISGPNVCRIHEFFEPLEQSESDCVAFLTMEFLEGTTLSDRIEAGLLPLKEASSIAVQLCTALQSIHEAGVIHRDLKPRNIMLVPHNGAERAVVMDFGLAHAVSNKSLAEEIRNTTPGMIMGTPEYMAPEQFEGREVTSATDIYALGLVLYELVTGRRLYAASTPFAAAVRRGRHPDAPSSVRHGISPVWDDVIAKCLEFDSERRYQAVSEIIEALNQHKLVILRFPQGLRISLTRRSLIAIASVALLALGIAGWLLIRDALSYHMSPQVKEWYDQGANDLREGTYLKASREFEMAVQLDQKYPLTHARLAEAWNELDFSGEAQKQLLFATAPDQKISMSKMDKKYVDAVRTTLIHDYSAAAQNYESILKSLPKGQKPQGMVDLGRAYEKAGRMKEALDKYEEAARVDSNNPAPFVHLGILKSRMRDPAGADAAFAQAAKIYLANSNLEGQAEVDYQRGYAANEVADENRALDFLYKSLIIGCQIDSVQLEIRALSQLSSVEYNSTAEDKTYENKSFDCSNQGIKHVVENRRGPAGAKRGHDQEALDYANLAILLANENGIEYWSTDGEMRLGNTYLDEEDYPDAESHLRRAIYLAQHNQHPRLEAGASLSIASVFNHDEKWDEEIVYAQRAQKYYKDYGFVDPAADASLLVIRGEEGKGDYADALQSGTEVLQLAEKTNSQLRILRAEEAVSSVWLDLEQYPSALDHSRRAFQMSHSIQPLEPYEALSYAGVLWHLGRYEEAQETLASISPNARRRVDIATGIADNQAQIFLIQGQYRKALEAAIQSLRRLPEMPEASKADLESVTARAEAALGQAGPSSQEADTLLALARKKSNDNMIAAAELAEAEVAIRAKVPAKAMSMAEEANKYFAAKGMKDSEWLSYLWMAEATKESGDMAAAKKNAKEAIDILHDLEQTWGSPAFAQFANRPDRKLEIQELSALAAQAGESYHGRN